MEDRTVEKATKIEMAPERLMVEQHVSDNVSKGGIVLPDQSSGKKLNKGTIFNMGKVTSENFEYPDMKAGDDILFAPFGGSEVEVDGKQYIIVSLQDVFGVIRE